MSKTQALTNIITAVPKSSQILIQTQVSVQDQKRLMFMAQGRVKGGVGGQKIVNFGRNTCVAGLDFK